MATNELSTTADRRVGPLLLVAALGFVLLYLGVDVVRSVVSADALPMPDAPVAEVRAWYVDNPAAAILTALCQFLSVTFLAGFVLRAPVGRARLAGLVAVGLMMVSSVLSWTMTAVAADASSTTLSALRTANFVTGGTAHVIALGAFVLLCARIPGMSRPVRVLGYVAAVPALLSVVSLVVFQGAALILLGRLLCMAWTVTAAISLLRRKSVPTPLVGT